MSQAQAQAQDTGKFRTNTKDQYYTKPEIAAQCVALLLEKYPEVRGWEWVEPSAGNGAFLKCVPAGVRTVGLDIDPKGAGIQKADFLTWTPAAAAGVAPSRLFFGNPPFGRQSSIAKAFLARAACFGDILAFILPLSFTKPSMVRSIPLQFHCEHSVTLPKAAFEVNGKSYGVPCVFQIWRRRALPRAVPEAAKAEGFAYTKEGSEWDIAVRRVGGLAGSAYAAGSGTYSVQAHYFLRLEEPFRAQAPKICEMLGQHEFPSNTVGPRSLSKGEVNEVLTPLLAGLLVGSGGAPGSADAAP